VNDSSAIIIARLLTTGLATEVVVIIARHGDISFPTLCAACMDVSGLEAVAIEYRR
jgi:ABC-type thiamin/hydroxymethylpyrimidine transport system permease subunit